MELNLTWEQVALATGGELRLGSGPSVFSRLFTDSRKTRPDGAFWALQGERHDAHKYLNADLAASCTGWVVSNGAQLPSARPRHLITVGDTRRALADLAAYHRARFDIPVVGITGTNGKTSVKDMLRSILSQQGPVCANSGNFNNEIGLPLSVLELTAEHRFGVFEMGASREGDIRYLCQAARPTAGLITNIGPAHLEFFGDIETVLKTKTELLRALPPEAPIILNGNDPLLAPFAASYIDRVRTFGTGDQDFVKVDAVAGGAMRLTVEGTSVEIPGKFGAVHRANAAAAAAAALSLGATLSDAARGLRSYTPSPLRFDVRTHSSGAELTVDAYNANPASMRAGIESFLELSCGTGRDILVLGDMAELGPEEKRMHEELGVWLSQRPVAEIYLAGPLMRRAAEVLRRGAKSRVRHFDDASDMAEPLREGLSTGDRVYFKASRAFGLERLAEAL